MEQASPEVDRLAEAIEKVVKHVTASLVMSLEAEIIDYLNRNNIPPAELDVNLASAKGTNRIHMELTHQKNKIRIIGTPTRHKRIEWKMR